MRLTCASLSGSVGEGLSGLTYGQILVLQGCNPSAKRKLPLARSDERPTLRKKSTAAATRVAGTSKLRWLGEYD